MESLYLNLYLYLSFQTHLGWRKCYVEKSLKQPELHKSIILAVSCISRHLFGDARDFCIYISLLFILPSRIDERFHNTLNDYVRRLDGEYSAG